MKFPPSSFLPQFEVHHFSPWFISFPCLSSPSSHAMFSAFSQLSLVWDLKSGYSDRFLIDFFSAARKMLG